MTKILIIIALIVWASVCGSGSQKRIAKIDSINFNLKANESKAWNKVISKNMNLSLMINIQSHEKQTLFKEIEIQMKNNKNKSVKCTFKYATNLCVLEESTQQVFIKIRCLQQNCVFKLSLSQRVIYHFDGINNHKSKMLTVPGEIYKLQKQKYNSLIQIHMEKREQKLSQQDIVVYSNVHAFRLSQIQQITTNNLIFGLKPILQNNDRYIYIEGDQSVKNNQLRANIITHEGTLNQGISIVDFVETFGHHSRNIYDYAGTFTKNIQIKARVFAPKIHTDIPFSIVVLGKNQQTQNSTQITFLQLNPIQFKEHSFHDFTFVVAKSQYSKFSIINFEVKIGKINDRAVFIELEVSDVAVSDIFIFDDVYFSAGQKQKLDFLVTPQVKYQIIGQDKQITIITNAEEKYGVSAQTCSLHKGCQLFIKTDTKCKACNFKFDLQDEDIKNHIIYYQVKNSSIQAKIDFEEELYFKYDVKQKSHTQLVVNNPNVMVYANFEDYPRCKIPNANCHQFVVNQQNPIIASNKKNQTQTLIVNVVGLEKTTFSLRFLDKLAQIKVDLGQKFSYLFDDEEQQITVYFNINNLTFTKEIQHISFNLISPINSLLLSVKNLGGQIYKSNDGYIEFPRSRIMGNQFQIKINKIGMFVKEFVHMTLIVTTADQGITLDSTTTHYQKYLPGAQHKFFMEYDPSQQNALNIYTEGLERTQSKMKLIIKDINLQQIDQQKKPFIQKALLRDNQVIDLDFQLQTLDICQEINCELQIIITSYSTEQLQQSLTVIHGESVILLEDSIWNSFQINELSKNNHFFYIPRVQNKSINILFNTEDRNLFIDYTIHNTVKSVNPQDWPWDHHSSINKEEITSHITGFQSYKIAADDPYIQDCWPNCVILITVLQSNKNVNTRSGQLSNQLIKTYKILASSTIVEAPQDTKFQITMQTNQQNSMFVQIKPFLKSDQFTFFIQYKVGRAKVTGTLINKGIQYKIRGDKKDFVFENVQTHLPISTITNALNRYNLKPEDTTLKITFHALTNVNMYFQFTSELKSFYRLNMDDLEVVTLREGDDIWYEFIPQRDFSIKFYRSKGFPIFKIFQCKEESYVECLTKNKKILEAQLKDKLALKQRTKEGMEIIDTNLVIDNAKQDKLQPKKSAQKEVVLSKNELQIFVDKNYQYTNQQCDNCMIFIWIYSYAQDLQLSINIRSSASEIELKQMAVVNDRIQKQNKHLKYLISVEPEMLAIITFRIVEGLCRVQVSDSSTLLYNSTYNTIDNDYQDIRIAQLGLPQTNPEEEDSIENDGKSLSNLPNVIKSSPKNARHHIFRHLHVKVTSLSEKPIQYLISYSIGFNGVFLQDGVVSEKELVPDVPHIYFYHNKDKNSHAYFSLSSSVTPGFDNQHSKNNVEVRFFYYPDSNNRDNKEEFRPQMPPKKNQNFFGSTITHVYQLPAKFQLYQIEIYSKNYLDIVTSINHKQIVYLPLGYEYLIKLHANQSIYLVVDRPKTDYLELSLKKCDTSVPTLYYTNDAKEFQAGIYQSKEQLLGSYEKKLIKTKKSSKTIHFKLVAEQYSETLFSITVIPEIDSKGSSYKKIKAGNNGLLSYSNIDANKIEIQFSPIVCQSKNCVVPPAQYYLLLARSMDNIYGELNCAGNYVISQAQKMMNYKSDLIEITGNYFDKTTGVYRYILTLEGQQQFIGVKANFLVNNKKTDVIYMPTQITSLWKQMTKMSLGIVLIISFALAVILSLAVIISAKLARRGYRPIAESQ